MQEDYFNHLTDLEKKILKDKGTEPPFSGEYNNLFDAGVFVCRACENPLYESNTKFNSGCGWPSFDEEIKNSIVRYQDLSLDRERTEICCAKCDGHLGHVFKGEKMTKKNTRHCVNSLSIKFKQYNHLQQATFGSGCFWNIDNIFRTKKGVYLIQVGYMGGEEQPTYEQVCSGKTKHIEVVNIHFDEKLITYNELLSVFWENHNPTTLNKQGLDEGYQYKSIIFYHTAQQKKEATKSMHEYQLQLDKPIVTEILLNKKFYRAEEYHQDYFNKNNLSGCSS